MLITLNHIIWNVSPWLYEGDYFAIGWYGTLWTLGLIGIFVSYLLTFKYDKMPINYALVSFMVTLCCIILFGHIFQGLFYEWYNTASDSTNNITSNWHYGNYYFEHPILFLTFTHGGFSSHGTIFGLLVAGWIMNKIMHIDGWYFIDRGMIGLCVLGTAVRIGNFINNEIYGVETTLPFGVVFGENTYAAHPTQIYEILSYLLALSIAIWLFIAKNAGQYRGLIASVIVLVVMIFRIAIEFVKLPQMEIEQTWLLNMGQILSVPFLVGSVWLAYHSVKKGVVGDVILPSMTRAEKRRIRKGIK